MINFSKNGHQFDFVTCQLHAERQSDPAAGSQAVPICQTISCQFQNTEHTP